MTMTARFPRTWAEVKAAPWCAFTEPAQDGDPCWIHVRTDWLPEGHEVDHVCSANGDTLREALENLRADVWPHMSPPVPRVPAVSIAAKLIGEIRKVGQLPIFNWPIVMACLEDAGGDPGKLQALLDQLNLAMRKHYG